MSNCECDIIVRQTQINGRIKTYYKVTGMAYDFNSARDLCHGLGGQLPIILTQDELDFLADTVIVKDDAAMVGSKMTWMGLKKENGHCFDWLDGTRVNMSFTYYSRCESCTTSCCAMYMWNDGDHKKMGFRNCKEVAKAVCVLGEENLALLSKLYGELNDSLKDLSQKTEKSFDQVKLHVSELESLAMKEHSESKKILDETRHQLKDLSHKTENNLDKVKLNVNELQSLAMKEHSESKKMLDETRRQLSETENQLKNLQTWVNDHVNIKTDLTDTRKEMDSLKKSSSTSNILHWTSLGIIGCLAVILAVIGYRTRRNLPVTRQTSVAYVAGEERLNFSSAGPSSPPSNTNLKTNNLYQAERNYCGAP